ncbi:MAG: hypothetical protein PHO91_04510, partial [Patescibacteria group bacterium]|nr:hypothetical protein [Patescibacteria group bacterium]
MQRQKSFILLFLLLIFSFGLIIAPQPAKAQLGGPVTVISDIPATLQRVWNQIEKAYDVVQGIVGAELANRTVEMYLNTIAHDIATQLASGGPGGKPMFRVTSMKNTLQKAGQSAAGEFLAELTTKGFDDLGINLCNPRLEMRLTLTLAVLDSEAPPKPRCEWRSVVNNWRNFDTRIQDDLLRIQLRGSRGSATDFFYDLMTGGGEIGDYLKLSAELNRRKLEAQKALELEIIECKGFIDNKTPVSDEVIAHCSQTYQLQASLFTSAIQVDVEKELARKEAASNRKLSDILASAAKRFTNTFTSKLLTYYMRQGPWGLDDIGGLFSSGSSDNLAYRNSLLDLLRGGADLRQPRGLDAFKEFKTVSFGQIESYDYLTNYVLCPDQFRNPDNCVMNPTFLQAVNSKMTVKEAIDRGIINGNIILTSDRSKDSNAQGCYRDWLCYSNLVKMRQANIIPVGWELAALRGEVSLIEAINCFEEGSLCKYDRDDNYAVGGVAHNPFYHLIDPNWVLKAPQAFCNSFVYSAALEDRNSDTRYQYCADPQFCLQEDSQGNCLDGQYGYCVRSENTWRFQGEECTDGDVYSGCLTFVHNEFGQGSYIENTLEYCSPDEAGCRRYSQTQDAQGNWLLGAIDSDSNDLFLNKQAADCPAGQAGCSEFIVMAADTNTNLIPNGDFEMDTSGNNIPDGYMLQPFGSTARIVAGEGVGGSNAIISSFPFNAMRTSSSLVLAPYTNYTVSIDVKLREGLLGDGPAWIGMLGCNDINGQTASPSSPDGSMYFDNGSINLS